MLTVIHRKGFKYPMVIDNHGLRMWIVGNRVYIYAIGLDEPNYPVPAHVVGKFDIDGCFTMQSMPYPNAQMLHWKVCVPL